MVLISVYSLMPPAAGKRFERHVAMYGKDPVTVYEVRLHRYTNLHKADRASIHVAYPGSVVHVSEYGFRVTSYGMSFQGAFTAFAWPGSDLITTPISFLFAMTYGDDALTQIAIKSLLQPPSDKRKKLPRCPLMNAGYWIRARSVHYNDPDHNEYAPYINVVEHSGRGIKCAHDTSKIIGPRRPA